MPEYADDILDDIAKTIRGQAGQFTSGQNRAPLTKASEGWELPNRSTPPTPASGAHLYASGGQLMVKKEDGNTFTIEPAPTIPQGVAVTHVSTADADATYGTAERDLINELKTRVNALLVSLENATIIAT